MSSTQVTHEGYKSPFFGCPSSGLTNRILRFLEGPQDKNRWSGKLYTIHAIQTIPSLRLNEGEEVYFVLGESVPRISTHPRPEQFAEVIKFANSEAEGVRLWEPFLLAQIWAAYKTRLLAHDQVALLEVADIIGTTKTQYSLSHSPCPLIYEASIEAERTKYNSLNSLSMRSEWLEVLHTPRMEILDGTVYVHVWATREGQMHYEDSPDKIAFWKITTTFSEQIQPDGTITPICKSTVRRIQHCYEDMVIQQRGTGNFAKNLNYKLFDTTFVHLAKRKFTGEEEGYTPGDERFRKFFVMMLKRQKNLTPESVKFLLNNCCVDTLDLSDAHETHKKDAFYMERNINTEVCADCAKCLTAALEGNYPITELNLTGMKMDGFNDCVPNLHITRLSLDGCRSLTSLEFLNLFPNLEHLSMAASDANIVTIVDLPVSPSPVLTMVAPPTFTSSGPFGSNVPSKPLSTVPNTLVSATSATTVPTNTVATNPFGPNTVAPNPFGPNTVAPNPFGPNTVPTNTVATNPFGPNTVATNPFGSNTPSKPLTPAPTVAPNPFGPNTVPTNTVAPNPFGPNTVATNPFGPSNTVAPNPFGSNTPSKPLTPAPTVAPNPLGPNTVAPNPLGPSNTVAINPFDLTPPSIIPGLTKTTGTTRTPCSTAPIETLTRLTHLDIQNTIYSASLNFINLTQLKVLNLSKSWGQGSWVDMSTEPFEQIVRSLPNLESLTFSADKIKTVTVLSELKHLRSVDIRVSPSTGLHVLTALTSLVLTCGGAVKTSTFEELKQLTQLAELAILPYLSTGGGDVEDLLSRLTKLRVFKAQQGDNNGKGLDLLSPCIEELHFNSKEFNPSITRLTNLKSLTMAVYPSTVSADLYLALAKMTQLEALEFSPMTNEGLGQLTTLVHLKELNIRHQKGFNSDGAVHFKHLTKLQRVSFYQTPISDLGLAQLTKLEHLERLSLKNTNVSKDAILFLENHRAYLEIDKDSYFSV